MGRKQNFLMLMIKNGERSDRVSIGGDAEYNEPDGNDHHFEGKNVDLLTQTPAPLPQQADWLLRELDTMCLSANPPMIISHWTRFRCNSTHVHQVYYPVSTHSQRLLIPVPRLPSTAQLACLKLCICLPARFPLMASSHHCDDIHSDTDEMSTNVPFTTPKHTTNPLVLK